MMLHFRTLNSMPQVLLQATSLSRSCCRSRQCCSLRTSLYSIQSSANNRMEDEVSLAMSFMNMRKSMGPSTVPWGTPDRTEASLDAWPSTTTLWDRLDRNDSIQAMTLLSRLKSWSLRRRRWCGILSNAFAKSSTATSAWERLLRMAARSWDVMISYVSHERRLRNPCWVSTRRWCWSRWRMVCETMMCSVSLQQIDVKDTGRQFSGLALSPFLKTGVTSAFRQSLGTVPTSSDCWMMKVSIEVNSALHVFRNTAGISSGPEAFFWFSWLRSLKTPLLETLIGGILGCGDFSFLGTLRRSSLVYTEKNCLLSMSALSWGSVPIRPSATRVPTPHVSFLIPLRYLHNPLLLPSLQSSNKLFK